MQGWVLMLHRDVAGYEAAEGLLVGEMQSDIESACRAITDDTPRSKIVSVEYDNGGDKAKIVDNRGNIYGAYLYKMPMREDVPTKW